MLNDYKPTHDPNIDTLQVQYLLGGSALLAVLFPYKYEFAEVRNLSIPRCVDHADDRADTLGLQYLVGICGCSSSALHAPANRRGRDYHDTLLICVGTIQSALYS